MSMQTILDEERHYICTLKSRIIQFKVVIEYFFCDSVKKILRIFQIIVHLCGYRNPNKYWK